MNSWRNIIQRMRYVIRCRRLVRVVMYEQGRIDNKKDKGYLQFPLENDCRKEFDRRYKKGYPETKLLAIGLDYLEEMGRQDKRYTEESESRLGIKADGIRLLTLTGFLNESAKSVNAILPILLSIVAITISIIALVIKSR